MGHLPHAHTHLGCSQLQFADSRCPDASCRIVDDATQSFLIVRITGQAEIGHDILDFLTLIERQSAIDAIGDGGTLQGLFERTALRVRAVEQSDLIITNPLSVEFDDPRHDLLRLFLIRLRRKELQLVASLACGIDIFLDLVLVVANDAVGSFDDVLSRTVVAFQFDDSRCGVVFLEFEDILDVGPTETINTLRIIPNNANTRCGRGQERKNAMLRHIRVLILIDENILEALHIVLLDLRIVTQEQEHIEQQVIKIHRTGLSQTLLIDRIDFSDIGQPVRLVTPADTGIRLIGRRDDEMVLGLRNTTCHDVGLIDFIVKLHLLHDRLDERFRICSIVDGEVVGIARRMRLLPKNTGEETMERTAPEITREIISTQLGNTFIHFLGRLVRKCQSQNTPRLDTMLEQVGYLVGENTCLAGAGPGQSTREGPSQYVTASSCVELSSDSRRLLSDMFGM